MFSFNDSIELKTDSSEEQTEIFPINFSFENKENIDPISETLVPRRKVSKRREVLKDLTEQKKKESFREM